MIRDRKTWLHGYGNDVNGGAVFGIDLGLDEEPLLNSLIDFWNCMLIIEIVCIVVYYAKIIFL